MLFEASCNIVMSFLSSCRGLENLMERFQTVFNTHGFLQKLTSPCVFFSSGVSELETKSVCSLTFYVEDPPQCV